MVSSKSFQPVNLVFFVCIISVLVSCTDSGTTTAVTGADPGVLEAPIAFVKRPVPVDEDGDEIQSDLREPLFFAEGGDVYLRSNSTVTATQENITEVVTGGQGDVKDLKPSFDGTKLLFTLRLFDEDENDDITPSWNIYEYDLETRTLRCIFDDDVSTVICDGFLAESGDDIGPAYLPNGRIIFSSNRQRQSGEMLTNEGKPRFKALDEDGDTTAMVLHVTNEVGDPEQISFNQSHDLDPSILTHSYNGEVMFTRWDNAAGNNAMHLYKINPDGTDLQHLYGVHSHDTGTNNTEIDNSTIQFSQPEEMEDGRIMVLTRPYTDTYGGGNIVIVDTENFVNNEQPVSAMTGLPGVAQTSATINNVSSADELSLAGRYSAAYPLWDGTNRVLVSKSTCELTINDVRRPCIEPYLSDVDAEEASPIYNIWLYDMTNDSEKIIVSAEQGIVITDIVALQSRPRPTIKSVNSLDDQWVAESIGAIHIESVYDFGDGSFNGCFLQNDCQATGVASTVSELGDPAIATADQRPARFVRFVKAVSLPDEDDPDLGDAAPDLDRAAFGPLRNQAMREIIGYAPVEPDGSVKVKVPANIPLAINVLDKNGRRIGARHQNWFQVKPGETMECTGCHTHTTTDDATPNIHHRRDAEATSINTGVPAGGVFQNTQIPGTTDVYFGNIGESMAEVRFRLAKNSNPVAEEPHVTSDVIFDDYWTDPALRAADTSFAYLYENLETSSPASATCLPTPPATWDFKCRILINYEQHIHPLWSIPRVNGVVDNTCTSCHTNFDNVLMLDTVPDAQLDLTDGDSDQEPEQFKSYRELFNTDQGEELDETGMLVTRQIEVLILENGIPQVDEFGVPTGATQLIDDPDFRFFATMSGNSARASYFMEKMTETELQAGRILTDSSAANYVDHSAFMSTDELRLISEWLDIGAQYFNDPFDPDVPQN